RSCTVTPRARAKKTRPRESLRVQNLRPHRRYGREVAIMKGDADVIEALNSVLTAELTAINQYFIHYKMCEDWGYQKLAKKKREESIEEMQHAEKVIARIL